MKKLTIILSIFAFIITLSGCNKNDPSVFIGDWKFESIEKSGEPAEASDNQKKFTISIKEDQTFLIVINGSNLIGKWEMAQADRITLLSESLGEPLLDIVFENDKIYYNIDKARYFFIRQ